MAVRRADAGSCMDAKPIASSKRTGRVPQVRSVARTDTAQHRHRGAHGNNAHHHARHGRWPWRRRLCSCGGGMSSCLGAQAVVVAAAALAAPPAPPGRACLVARARTSSRQGAAVLLCRRGSFFSFSALTAAVVPNDSCVGGQ